MDDLISKNSLWKSIVTSAILEDKKTLEQIIDEEPTIDAVPVIRCKDCRKHNVEHGYYPGGHVVRKEDSCPLVAYRGKAQGHEYDYQYCVFGERREE